MAWTVLVKYKGSAAEVRLPPTALVAELQEQLAERFGIMPAAQKLISKGQLSPGKTLEESGLTDGAKIMLIGSTEAEVQGVRAAEQEAKQRAAAVRPAATARRARPTQPVASGSDLRYRFHAIEVLPGFDDQDKARALLTRLAEDLGIRGLLRAHQWAIGVLCELSPTEHTILGYNRNKGERIALRLRTDNFQGFRHYDTIRKVLLHELAHMVYSEHNSDFHHFNRELTKEADRIDWTKSGGHRLGGGETPYEPEDDSIDGAFQGGTYTLGGDRSKVAAKSARELMLEAASLRLTTEEQEITDGCNGSAANGHHHSH